VSIIFLDTIVPADRIELLNIAPIRGKAILDHAENEMKIEIDGRAGLVDAEPGSSLGEILAQLADWLSRNGRAVVSFTLDGTELDEPRRRKLAKKNTDDFKLLEVTSLSPYELAATTITGLMKTLPVIEESLSASAANIQRGDSKKGLKTLLESVEALAVVADSADKASRLVQFDFGELKVDGKPVIQKLSALHKMIAEARDALKRKDLVSVADFAEYELKPEINAWREVTQALLDAIMKKAEKEGLSWEK
jgi:hypothetical protein